MSDALCKVKENFYRLQQGECEGLQDYNESLKSHTAVMEEVGASLEDEALLASIAAENGPINPNDDDQETAKEQAVTKWFIYGSNYQCQAFLHKLWNQFLSRQDLYLRMLHEVYNIMQRHTGDRVQYTPTNDGLSFVQKAEEHDRNECTSQGTSLTNNGQETTDMQASATPGMDGQVFADVQCYSCNQFRHYASNCSNVGSHQVGDQHLTIGSPSGFSFSQVSRCPLAMILKTWVLLDSQNS